MFAKHRFKFPTNGKLGYYNQGMNPTILARLNAKSQSLLQTFGKAELTPADISAALSGTQEDRLVNNEIGIEVLLAKICNNRQSQVKCFYPIYRGVAEIAIKGKWKMKRGEDRLRSLTQLAVFEATNDQACPRCKGTTFNPRNPTKACEPCRGTGRYRIKDYERAEALGVSKQTWSRTWEPRYQDVQIFIETQEHKALKSIAKKLA